MAPKLDRLLETCVRREALYLQLIAGHAPGMMLASGWRVLELPALTQGDVEALAAELASFADAAAPPEAADDAGDAVRFPLRYGGAFHFRVVIAGREHIESVWLIRHPPPGTVGPAEPS